MSTDFNKAVEAEKIKAAYENYMAMKPSAKQIDCTLLSHKEEKQDVKGK